MEILKDVSLAPFTTLGVGGQARELIVMTSIREARQSYKYVLASKLPWAVIGLGSNLLISDAGFDGVVLVNRIKNVAGMPLDSFVDQANAAGIAGFENLAGIPGTVAGAVYGNAGAYGQTVSDRIISVVTPEGQLLRSDCNFGYRDSILKSLKPLILSVVFDTSQRTDPNLLCKKSAQIRKIRNTKFPPSLKCPGSFFKNIDSHGGGKIPAGQLLQAVGACGMSVGKAKVAEHHGNLIYNTGGATASEILELAKRLRDKVYEKFGIKLEPEVQTLPELFS